MSEKDEVRGYPRQLGFSVAMTALGGRLRYWKFLLAAATRYR